MNTSTQAMTGDRSTMIGFKLLANVLYSQKVVLVVILINKMHGFYF